MRIKEHITVGQRFGRLVTLEETIERNKRGEILWICQCDCGKTHRTVRRDLVRGNTRSCGCFHRDQIVARQTTHGHSKGGVSPTYASWSNMHARCRNPKRPGYKNWGGRGIKVCERWEDFANFLADMGERPAKTSLDRYPNNDGNYEPSNCRWATRTQQNLNKRKGLAWQYILFMEFIRQVQVASNS